MTKMPFVIGPCRAWKSLQAAVLIMAYGLAATPTEEAAGASPTNTLTGSWRARAKVEERGVVPFAGLTTEAWGNVAGGLQRGGWWNSLAGRAATLRLGLSYHTGPVDDFSGSTAGDPPATTQTVPNWCLIHDLEILANREGRTKLGLFARGGITPQSDRSVVAAYADAGLNWFAPLPSRPDDAAGVAVSYTRFGSTFQASAGPDGVASTETTLELTYKAQVTRWMALQADVQFLFNPAVNPGSGSRETATVLGLRAEITL